jgi:uncharacterized Zn finger protein
MPREDIRPKATRYLNEGRVTVLEKVGDTVTATARGEGALYSVSYSPSTRWTCSCPARSEACAHLYALKRITAPDLGPDR